MILLNYISFLCGFLLFLFAFYLLVTKNGNQLLNRLILLVMMARGYQLLFYTLADTGALLDYPYFVRIIDPIIYISPAAFYLYFKGFIKDKAKLDPYEWLHFLPILFGILDLAFWWGSSMEFKMNALQQIVQHKSVFFQGKFGFFPTATGYLIRNTIFLTYLFFSWRVFIRSGVWKEYKTNSWMIKWILCLLIFSTAGQLTFFVSLISALYHNFENLASYQYALQITINLTFLLLLVVFLQPRFLFGYLLFNRSVEDFNQRLHTYTGKSPIKNLTESESVEPEIMVQDDAIEEKAPEKIRKKLIHADQEAIYLRALNTYMDEKKPYLKPDFKIGQLAIDLDIPRHHCIYLLNYSLNKTFTDWVNEYRIRHFLELYQQKSQMMTIEALANESGFGNRRTFARVFAKYYGMSPSEYLTARS